MCVLRASGGAFDVDSFLAASSLSPYKVTKSAGLQRRVTDSPAREVPGFRVELSRASWSELAAQAKDAETFLEAHRSELLRLRDYPGVEDVRLDFAVESTLGPRVTAQFVYLPPKLLAAAGSLGIGVEVSLYPAQRSSEEG